MKGNEAAAEGAIAGGCRHFFGYPITPQNEIPEYMALHMPDVGGVYLQAESEVAAINMVFGAAATGARVMTSSSGPGISLMQEALSYMVGARVPCLVVNVCRGGPGLGNIGTSQSDYWLATRGAGHGDGRCITFAPATLQEQYDLCRESFEVAERYRHPVMVLSEAALGQMMEPVIVQPRGEPPRPELAWAIGGERHGRKRRVINSLYAQPPDLEAQNLELAELYQQVRREQTRWVEVGDEDPEVMIVAYGIPARCSETAMERAAEHGIRARLVRPVSLFPFPHEPIRRWSAIAPHTLVVEASIGQMVDDVRTAVGDQSEVSLLSVLGGLLTTPERIAAEIRRIVGR
ncbi:MAG: 3-methyl-2-oxobutanoate dehydrogenase subunit VorB [Armatimonadetes bacterium]|nr:3-methyl-2-oxobutanoate dehydrogenase subunit VorB [Armatimonadota bacterium]